MAKKVTILLNCTYNDGKKIYAPGETLTLDVKEAEALEKMCFVSYPTTKPVEEKVKKGKEQQTEADAKNGADAENTSDAKNNSEQNNEQEDATSEHDSADAHNLDPDALDEMSEE